MSDCPFCTADRATDRGRPIGLLRRWAWRGVQWFFPTAVLVLMPKCAFCVAAYVALFTGVGITVSTARWIQLLLLAFSLISLAYLAFNLKPFLRRSNNVHRTSHAG